MDITFADAPLFPDIPLDIDLPYSDVVSVQRSMIISVWISDTNLCTNLSPETSNKSSSSSPPLSKRPGMNRHSSSSGSVSSLASSSSGVGGSILVGRAEFCPLVAKDGEAVDSWISYVSPLSFVGSRVLVVEEGFSMAD